MATGYTIVRSGLSLPCSVPVLPGTSETDADLQRRTEKCSHDEVQLYTSQRVAERAAASARLNYDVVLHVVEVIVTAAEVSRA